MIPMKLQTLGDDRNYTLMNDWDEITNNWVVIGITSLSMIEMELLTLDGDRNHNLMDDWYRITNTGVMT